MAWLSRTNWSASDNRPTWSDLNSWGLDLRTWGGDVDGGGHSLANLSNVSAWNLNASGLIQIVQSGSAKAKFSYSSNIALLTAEGDSSLKLCTNGYPRLSIDSSGRVGIGTEQPVRTCHIAGSALEVVLEENTAPANQKKWRVITGGAHIAIDALNDNISQATTGLIIYRSGTTLTAVAIPSCGLAIGTAAPSAPLHVQSTAVELLRLQSLGSDVYIKMFSASAFNTISMDGGSGIYIGGGNNAPVYIRNCDGGWGHQAKFDGANKRIYFYGLPSSSAGLTSGAIWYDPNDGYRLKYVP